MKKLHTCADDDTGGIGADSAAWAESEISRDFAAGSRRRSRGRRREPHKDTRPRTYARKSKEEE